MAATGTIFDNPWFAFERPAFRSIMAQSDAVLTALLLIAAIVIMLLAFNPKTPPVLKAVVLAYITLP
jgi:hypothetical protein